MKNELKELEEEDKQYGIQAVYVNEPEDYNLVFVFPKYMMYSTEQLRKINFADLL